MARYSLALFPLTVYLADVHRRWQACGGWRRAAALALVMVGVAGLLLFSAAHALGYNVIGIRLAAIAFGGAMARQLLEIDREIGNRWGEGWALNDLGSIALRLGAYEEARAYYEEVLRLREQCPDAEVTVLHRGIRVWGFDEELFEAFLGARVGARLPCHRASRARQL